MPTFIFKIDNKEVTFDSVAPGLVRESFQNLRTTILHQLQSLQCETHHHEPVVILQSDGDEVTLAGFVVCCRGFGYKVKDRITLPEGTFASDVVITTREFSYKQQE